MSYGQKHVLWGHSDLDLWRPHFNQFKLKSERTFIPDVKNSSPGVPDILPSLKWTGGHSDIDLWQKACKFPEGVAEIPRSWEADVWRDNVKTFFILTAMFLKGTKSNTHLCSLAFVIMSYVMFMCRICCTIFAHWPVKNFLFSRLLLMI